MSFIIHILINHNLKPVIGLIGKPAYHEFRQIIISFDFNEVILIDEVPTLQCNKFDRCSTLIAKNKDMSRGNGPVLICILNMIFNNIGIRCISSDFTEPGYMYLSSAFHFPVCISLKSSREYIRHNAEH